MARIVEHKCEGCQQTKKFRVDYRFCSPQCRQSARGTAVTPSGQSLAPEHIIEIEMQKLRDKKENKDATIHALQERVLKLEEENAVFSSLRDRTPQVIDVRAKETTDASESAMVVALSDWHLEERVLGSQVGNKNEYDLTVFDKRFWNLCRGIIAWYKIEAAATSIQTIVLALLGDFITGSIHDDLAEGNQLAPAEAIYKAFSYLVALIQFVLDNTPREVKLVIPCHSGNHGRMTKEQRIATESGNSLEYFMYLMLRDHFEGNKRVEFNVQAGYHSFVRFFDGEYEIRFHHGHQINYQGGVGGITIPVNKAIAQWNKAHPVDLDVFGHFHTKFDGGNFICNGSLIGYNAYAVSIKASFEVPAQQVFLVNREYGAKTMVAPIFVD